ncbi:MAG TPA: hypothetical protein VI815_04360 [Candidatus Nanoarchaeia archaeon]|nr:hypothetical protein [Candidatus Nanoarchaeia archaeon]
MVKRVKFGVSKVQQLNRIAFPTSLLENIKLNIGNSVEIYLDIDEDEIIIKKVKNAKK